MKPFPASTLNDAGLNRQAVFDLAALPAAIYQTLAAITDDLGNYRQLLLIGHGGRQLWDCVKASGIASAQPIDDFTIKTLEQCFAAELPEMHYQLLYPSQYPIGLQQLGALAGWQHASPFMLGIDDEWGSWSAYRAVLLADSHFPPTSKVDREHPCDACRKQPCLAACPAGALQGGTFSLPDCLTYRQKTDSACQYRCLARLACPVGSEHRYNDQQLRHTYGISLRWIKGMTQQG